MSSNEVEIEWLKNYLSRNFEVKYSRDLKYCLGLEFKRKENYLCHCNPEEMYRRHRYSRDSKCAIATRYLRRWRWLSSWINTVEKVLDRKVSFIENFLVDLARGTRPNITHAVSYQFNNYYWDHHWKAANTVLWYLKGTKDLNLVYSRSSEPPVIYTDADWRNCYIWTGRPTLDMFSDWWHSSQLWTDEAAVCGTSLNRSWVYGAVRCD